MNKQRRKQIAALKARFDALNYADIKSEMDAIKDELETLKDEEQEYLDNMSENLKGGDKAQVAESAISEMESIGTALEAAVEALDALDNEVNFDGAMGEG